ncbi:Cyclic nucleotide-binding domain-containing protein [Aphelenchoides bicaudatus]|nr:Cyclic nucleotide-binding domain-containing protein [Aphelenchoides bicaudatus]
MATLSPLTNSSPAICRELSEKTDAEVLQRKELHQDKTNEEALHNVLPLSQMSSTEDVELENAAHSTETPNGNTNNVSNNTNNNTANVTNSQNDTQPALPNNANASNEVARAEERRPRTPLIVRLKKLFQIIKTAPFETIDSSHSPYYYWSFVVYIAFLYNALMCVMFVFDNMQGSFFTFWFCCNMFFDFVYLLDIFINSKLSEFSRHIECQNCCLFDAFRKNPMPKTPTKNNPLQT